MRLSYLRSEEYFGPLHIQTKGHDYVIQKPHHRCWDSYFVLSEALKHSVKWECTMLREHCIFHWWERGVILPHSLHIFILFFHLFLEFYMGEEGKKRMMIYHERRRILLALALYWCLCNMCLICKHWYSMKSALIFSICFECMNISNCSVWAFERNVRFTNRWLLGSSMVKIFEQEARVSHNTFEFFFLVRDWVCTYRRLQIWKRQFQLRVELQCHYEGLRIGNTLSTIGEVRF